MLQYMYRFLFLFSGRFLIPVMAATASPYQGLVAIMVAFQQVQLIIPCSPRGWGGQHAIKIILLFTSFMPLFHSPIGSSIN
jgi:hypothetical protein